MSIAVPLEDLPNVIGERGAAAYLVTVRDDRPHVVAVSVAVRDRALVMAPGRRTARNIEVHPRVTVMWPVSADHPDHTLLVDGSARLSDDEEWLIVEPADAVLHRAGGRRRRLDG